MFLSYHPLESDIDAVYIIQILLNSDYKSPPSSRPLCILVVELDILDFSITLRALKSYLLVDIPSRLYSTG